MSTPKTKPEVGRTYEVWHIYSGTFLLKVTGIAGGKVSGIIIFGRANAFFAHNERRAGEAITIRERFSIFTPFTSDHPTFRELHSILSCAGL